ncbi:MAG: hypothetical protein ABIJ56_05210 [Pseudomonadota bacterium]
MLAGIARFPAELGGRLISVALCGACAAAFFLPLWQNPKSILIFTTACGFLILLLMFFSRGPIRGALCAAACLFLFLLTSTQLYQAMPFFPQQSVVLKTAIVLAFAGLAVCAAANASSRAILIVSVVAGTALRVIALRQWELNAFLRDMLPLIESALSSFVDGRNPYRLYYLTHDVPLTYMPVMWLSYLPAWLAGIDIRWMNVCFALLTSVLIYRWGGVAPGGNVAGRPGAGRLAGRLLPRESGPLFLMAAIAFMFQTEIFWNTVHGEPPAYWLWLALMLTCVQSGRLLSASVLLGVAIATRHFSILFVPFFAVWLKAIGCAWKDVIARVLVAGAVAVALVLPWLMRNPDSFLFGTFEWLVKYGPAYEPAWVYQLGFQSTLYEAGLKDWFFVIQNSSFAAILAAAAAAVFLMRRAGRRELAVKTLWAGCGLAYFVYVLLGNMVWKSFFVSTFLLAILAFAAAGPPSPKAFMPGSRALKAILIALLALVNIAAGAFVVKSLRAWNDRSDVAAFARETMPLLEEGDLLIDYSYYNAFHVFQGSAYAPDIYATIGQGMDITVTAWPRNHELAGHGRVLLFDGYGAHDPGTELADIAGTYEKIMEEKRGRSRFYIFKSPSYVKDQVEAWRFSRHFNAVQDIEMRGERPPTFHGWKYEDKVLYEGMDPWVWTGPYTCLSAGGGFPSIFSQLMEGKTLHMKTQQPGRGALWLFTSFDDRMFVRPLGSVMIRVKAGKLEKTIEHPGERGIYSWYLGRVEKRDLVMDIETEKPGPGMLCFDLVVMASKAAGEIGDGVVNP